MSHAPSFERTVVTGGTGFIGQHLLQGLVDAGHSPVAITRKFEQIDRLPEVLREKVRWIELDLLNLEAVKSAISIERPSVLFHLAGTRGDADKARNALKSCTDLNVDATLELIAAANQTGVERIVITGSAEEYGNQSGPFDEKCALQPVSSYGKSKAEATRRALSLSELEKCPVVVARLFTVYGPNQPRGMFVSDAIYAAVNDQSFSMSEGVQQRDLIFVDDIVTALIACARTPEVDGKVFNFGSGQPVRLRDLAKTIWRISETTAPLIVGDRPRSNDDLDLTWADSSFARQCLGWSPKVDLETGLKRMIEWVRKGRG